MKTENYPIKIECFALRGALEYKLKEPIGHILVSVRNIPILSINKAVTTRPRWYKIIGLSRAWRQQRPELLMNIIITEKDFLQVDRSLVADNEIDDCESIIPEVNPSKSMMQSQKGIFIKLLEEEGVVQVGDPNSNCDIFVIKILLKNVKHLEKVCSCYLFKLDYSFSILGRDNFVRFFMI